MQSSYGISYSLETTGLLALLITLGLPLALRCYGCEEENSFGCSVIKNCSPRDKFCVIGAVKVLPRFYMVSKQCSQVCPATEYPAEVAVPPPPKPKPFGITEPMPFFYVRCCKSDLCNFKGLPTNEMTLWEQAGKASQRKCVHTQLLLPGHLVLTATALLWP